VQHEPLQGKLDLHQLTLTSQKMADSKHITSSPLAQTANPQRALPDGTSGIIAFGPYRLLFAAPTCRDTLGGGEGDCPLWDGLIIDATFPLV
jgi:hypothetical protein